MNTDAFDVGLRTAAIGRVRELQRIHGDGLPWEVIAEGFEFRGDRFHLASKAQGIYTPSGHHSALSVKTTVPRAGRSAKYEDELSSDGETMRYAYKERGGPDCVANRTLRETLRRSSPIIYFFGVGPGVYAALAPVYVVGDNRDERVFHLVPGEAVKHGLAELSFVLPPAPERRYAARLVRQRLHQQAFRRLVLGAYAHHCAMCSIHFDEFLEAAHILPDRDVRGRPEVDNGLALCSLHHQAFDRFLVDVTDDYKVSLSPGLQKRRNGPIFQRAFLDRHDQPLHLPKATEHLPSLEHLRARRKERPSGLW